MVKIYIDEGKWPVQSSNVPVGTFLLCSCHCDEAARLKIYRGMFVLRHLHEVWMLICSELVFRQ